MLFVLFVLAGVGRTGEQDLLTRISERDLRACVHGLTSPSPHTRVIAYLTCEGGTGGVSRGAPLENFMEWVHADFIDCSIRLHEMAHAQMFIFDHVVIAIWWALLGRPSRRVQLVFLDMLQWVVTFFLELFYRCAPLHVAALSVVACGTPSREQCDLLAINYFCVLLGLHFRPAVCRLVSVVSVFLLTRHTPWYFCVLASLCAWLDPHFMPPKSKLTAAEFQQRYGDLVAQEYADYTTPRTLSKALEKRKPPIFVTDGVLRNWFANCRIPADAVKVSSALDLNEKCGTFLGALAANNSSAFLLGRALKTRTPPVYATDGVLKEWFRRYFDAEPVNSAGHLELKVGDRIREELTKRSFDAAGLRVSVQTIKLFCVVQGIRMSI